MPQINQVKWAKVKIDNQDFWQVLIIGDQVLVREVGKVKKEHGTDHLVTEEERKLLFSTKPEVILIANGWSGVLKVDDSFKEESVKKGIDLRVLLTPKIKSEYNRLVESGKKVNALIHTTC